MRILDELEPGAVFSLWKATVSRYVMAENRKEDLFKDFFIWDDFPSEPGQVNLHPSCLTNAGHTRLLLLFTLPPLMDALAPFVGHISFPQQHTGLPALPCGCTASPESTRG